MMRMKPVIVDKTLAEYIERNSDAMYTKLSRVYVSIFAVTVAILIGLGIKVVDLGTNIHYDEPSFVKPNGETITLTPVYRPPMSLSTVKNIARQYTAEVMSIDFSQIKLDLENSKKLFFSESIYERDYLEPLMGSHEKEGSLQWIAANNLVISASSATSIQPIFSAIYEESGVNFYKVKVAFLQSLKTPSGDNPIRHGTAYLTLIEVPRAVNINGLQIYSLGMKSR